MPFPLPESNTLDAMLPMKRLFQTAALLALAPWVAVPIAAAQPAATDAESESSAEAQARAHFKKGNEHFDRKEWQEALDEFRKALAQKRTRASIVNEAACLKQLGRFDEALDAYEALRKEFPVLPPKLEATVAPAIEEARRLVGTVALAGDVPAQGWVFVDDKRRSALPLAAPLRLAKGLHRVRIETDGFDPIAATVEVKPEQASELRLNVAAKRGRLRVVEKRGWPLDVEIDGVVVGKTPWEGLVEPGEHQVVVRGFVRLDADDEVIPPPAEEPSAEDALARTAVGSAPSKVDVRFHEVTSVVLGAKDLDGLVRIQATPASAAVSIDGKVVALGSWAGRLPLGEHTLELAAADHFPTKKQLRLERRKELDLRLDLVPVPKPVGWSTARTVVVGGSYGLGAVGLAVGAVTGTLALSTSNDAQQSCRDGLCPESERDNLEGASTLATASTISFVVGGAGIVAGTTFAFWFWPGDAPAEAPTVGTSVAPGRLELGGRF